MPTACPLTKSEDDAFCKVVAHVFTGGRLVKSFNHWSLPPCPRASDRWQESLFLASDDDAAAEEIGALAENLGFSRSNLAGFRKADSGRAEIAGGG